ncbi:MAG: chorismate mutase [Ruminococcus sp.]|nr:chorismate mutase [Ruminococcus sp.]MBR2282974.1 chorismate mutase [Ruminococcus sp.]
MDLQELRNGIDDIDEQLLRLFMKRMELCRDVAEYKRQHDMPVFQGGREQQVIDRIRRLTGDSELENGTAALFTNIMDISKILQNRSLQRSVMPHSFTVPDLDGARRIGCQGMPGANSETAARMMFGERELVFYPTFEDVFRAVQSGELDYGVLPVNNSTAGSVNGTYDLMAKYSVYTVREVSVEINHCLAVLPGTELAGENGVRLVYSHPQAIAQCYEFLTANRLKTAEHTNTAVAAAMVAESKPEDRLAAICSVECAERLGLTVLARDIADATVNRTRFICISRELQADPEADVVSVMLKIPHTEGSLYRLLTKFFVSGMNLMRIENRPIKDGSFDVWFYLDFSGRLDDANVSALMSDLAENLEDFRILGTFKSFE